MKRLPPPGIEITVEANPGRLTGNSSRRLKLRCQPVVFRVQTMDPAAQAAGPPVHLRGGQAGSRISPGAGFNNLSLDVMYGLPRAVKEQWQDTVEVLAFDPEHLSAYSLKVIQARLFSA